MSHLCDVLVLTVVAILCMQYFTVWRERTGLSIEGAEQENERMREAREQLNRGELSA